MSLRSAAYRGEKVSPLRASRSGRDDGSTMSVAPKIAIIGGGIGGLAAALCICCSAGFDVHVFEQALGASARSARGCRSAPTPRASCIGLGLEPASWPRPGVRPLAWSPAALGRRADAPADARRPGRRSRRPSAHPHYQLHRGDLARRCWARAVPRRAACTSATGWSAWRSAGERDAWRGSTPAARRPRPIVLVGADGIHLPRAAARRSARGAPALHGLRRLARAGAGRAGARISTSRSPRTTGWARTAMSCTTGWRAAAS